jgi:hypothetical protein
VRDRYVSYRVTDEDEDDTPLPRRRPRPGSTVLDFLLLRRHVAPTLIVVFFWLGTAGLVVSGLSTLVGSFNAPKGPSIGGLDLSGLAAGDGGLGGGFPLPTVQQERGFSFSLFLFGLCQLFLGPIILRVVCELAIVVFRIHETLRDLKDRPGRDGT